MPGIPVVLSPNGTPVTEALNGFGTPIEIAENGFGTPVTIVEQGGMPVIILNPPEPPSIDFPATGAVLDMDWANNQFVGPAQSLTANSGPFTSQIAPNNPCFAEQQGGSLRRFTATCVHFVNGRGVVIDGDRFNRVLWSNDLTNAVWVATNVTVAKNQSCRAGIANNASRVTVGADGATILQTRTLTSLALSSWIDVRRVSGSGTIEFTLDGGTSWTVLDLSTPIFGSWCRPGVPEQTVENPTWGFRFSTAGDVFDIAYVNSVGDVGVSSTVEYSPNSVTSGTQIDGNRDRPSARVAESSPVWSYFSSSALRVGWMEFAARRGGGLLTGDVQNILHAGSGGNGAQAFGAAAQTANQTVLTTNYHNPVWNKIMFWQSATETGICLNGGEIARGAGAAPLTFDHIDLGTNGSGALTIDGFIRRLVLLDYLPDDELVQAWTAI